MVLPYKFGGVMTKKCYKCGQVKSLDRFYKKTSNTTDSLSGRCKKCDNILKTNWRKNNSKKVKLYEKGRWRNTNKREKDIERNRKYRVEMTDLYIRDLIIKQSTSLNRRDIPDELVKSYRAALALKRLLKLTPKLKGEEDQP